MTPNHSLTCHLYFSFWTALTTKNNMMRSYNLLLNNIHNHRHLLTVTQPLSYPTNLTTILIQHQYQPTISFFHYSYFQFKIIFNFINSMSINLIILCCKGPVTSRAQFRVTLPHRTCWFEITSVVFFYQVYLQMSFWQIHTLYCLIVQFKLQCFVTPF